MGRRGLQCALVLAAAMAVAGSRCDGQVATGAAPNSALDAASGEIGRALLLRCLCSGDALRFDANGQPIGAVKTTDWTLAGVDVEKVEVKAASGKQPGSVELEGVRVAIHYVEDRHEFERKPQKDERVRIVVENTGDAAKFRQALETVFAQGIDRRLQQSLPAMWQHFFEPNKPWENDELSGQTLFNAGAVVAEGDGTETVTTPETAHKVAAESTTIAMRDHVQGTVVLRLVVDTEGVPHRVSVVEPLGYGLDAQAVAAAGRMRFRPGTLGGKPVAVAMLLREEFVLVPRPGS